MKTLFERLKPEVNEKLNLQFYQFPYTITKLFNALKENKFISDLNYETILNIGSFYSNDLNTSYLEISNLFENDLE